MTKVLGILGLLVAIVTLTSILNPAFLSAYNLQNLVRWTALFGVLSIGAAFVIVSGGIDLSIGSVVGLVGSVLAMLVGAGWTGLPAVVLVIVMSAGIGLLHGLLVTKARLQPFVVTLCGLLFYRGLARWLTDDQTQGFGTGQRALRSLATGRPMGLPTLLLVVGAASLVWCALQGARRPQGGAVGDAVGGGGRLAGRLAGRVTGLAGAAALALGLLGTFVDVPLLSELRAPTPFLILIVLTATAGFALNETVWGRHLLAVGKNEQAARYSGIRTDRVVISAYVVCASLAGVGGVLFALDLNAVQPASHGNFYELYAIAAAVLGGCSLRGGEGSILGVVVGAAVMRTLYNSINLLRIPTQLEFAIIGAVILAGVLADELLRRAVARRRGRGAQG